MAPRFKVGKTTKSTRELKARIPAADIAAMPYRVNVPDEPSYRREDGNTIEYEAQQIARVELLMLKGIRQKRVLLELLDIKDHRALDRYMKAVQARWEIIGTMQDFARHRGEGLARLDLIDSELWSRLSNVETKASPMIALNFLKAIAAIQEQRAAILGLTPKVIAAIGSGEGGLGDVPTSHDKLTLLMRRLNDKIEDRMRVVSDDRSQED